MASALTKEKISSLRDQFKQNKEASILTRTVTKNGIHAASYDNTAATRLNRTFSIELDTGKVTNQKHSGRCWEFSMLNTLRHTFAKNIMLKISSSHKTIYFFGTKSREQTFSIKISKEPLKNQLMIVKSNFSSILPARTEVNGQWQPA